MQHNALPNAFEALKPIIGTLLLQHENAFAEPLNGPLWYLPAILIMHLIIDLCRRTKYQHTIMMLLCIISFVLYAANKYWYFSPQLTPMGLMRNLPYYYIGYLCAQKQWFSSTVFRRNLIGCIGCLCISIILFDWHLRAFFNGEHIFIVYGVMSILLQRVCQLVPH
jgi:surface polysaccharide O-acyltransferase-like enzyme